MGEEEIILIYYVLGCFLFPQLSRVGCISFVSYASFFPCIQAVCWSLRVQENGRCDEVLACLEKLLNEDGRLGVLLVSCVPFPMINTGMQIIVVYGSGSHDWYIMGPGYHGSL
jgi:hypothetical protein